MSTLPDTNPPLDPVQPVATEAPVSTALAPRRPRRWMVGLALTAIFLFGALVGALGTLRVLQQGVRQRVDPARWSAAVLGELDQRLQLTPAQHDRIAPLMLAGAEEARLARRRAFGEARGIIERTHTQIAAELNDTQRAELERFLEERRQRAHRWLGPIPGDGPPMRSRP